MEGKVSATFYVTCAVHTIIVKNIKIQKEHISVKRKMTNYVKLCDQSKDVEKNMFNQ